MLEEDAPLARRRRPSCPLKGMFSTLEEALLLCYRVTS